MIAKFVLLCIFGMFITGCDSSSTTAPEPADPALKSAKEIFLARCSICHSTSRPLGKHKTPEEWKETVTRMHNKAPDKISDSDVEKIVNYLKTIRGPEK